MATNVIPFSAHKEKRDNHKLLEMTVPFDRSNPDHVRLWNTAVNLGRVMGRA